MSDTNFDESQYSNPTELRAARAEFDLEQVRHELTATKNRLTELEDERTNERLTTQLCELAAGQRGSKLCPRDLARLLAEDVQMGKEGRLISRRPGMSLDETLKSFREVHSYLFSGEDTATGTSALTTAKGPRLEELFGRKSDAKLANKFAMESPDLYRSMRVQAQKAGLI